MRNTKTYCALSYETCDICLLGRELQQTLESMTKIEEEKESLFKATEGLQTTLEVRAAAVEGLSLADHSTSSLLYYFCLFLYFFSPFPSASIILLTLYASFLLFSLPSLLFPPSFTSSLPPPPPPSPSLPRQFPRRRRKQLQSSRREKGWPRSLRKRSSN